MTDIQNVSLLSLWVLVALNLLITMQLSRWVKKRNDERHRAIIGAPELSVGQPAPDFRARTLDGEPVRLNTFAGRALGLMVVSPLCGICRDEMPYIHELAAMAKNCDGVEFVFASATDAAVTRSWLDEIRKTDGFDVTLPVVVAAPNSTFLRDYDPRGGTPYFCLIDSQGVVQSRSLLVDPAWITLERRWTEYGRSNDRAHV